MGLYLTFEFCLVFVSVVFVLLCCFWVLGYLVFALTPCCVVFCLLCLSFILGLCGGYLELFASVCFGIW